MDLPGLLRSFRHKFKNLRTLRQVRVERGVLRGRDAASSYPPVPCVTLVSWQCQNSCPNFGNSIDTK
jgi:hypothetical protein